ncbi:PAS domain S-box-containing protein/diguanylate cyclase (GGDEF) domain-containing protein [Arsukibacterium tuosuense]|uniref:PAS domain S-box-containing protein/diguanylate cyclase (GGDEF) domain-containing protein n=1 Tax=Arsukibacterium tuosuense TaxID=1323745 RepID=A0A285JIQ0_9GAMM|nr:GGDEF domain-containing protein [Arsukibacterium tuosuense]SNY59256.1 PAS domain S-box-containing protein/diguanylate cyclase (GGDEF) domain-containing protein [Arsukibacterium tuosuense]
MTESSYTVLSNYIDLLLDAICVVDKQGCFEYISPGAERIFGYTPQEMIGHSMLEFIHPDDQPLTLTTAEQINQGAVKLDFENRYIRKDGTVVHLLWSARWSEDKQQRVAVARDISNLKHVQRREAALYAISEAAFAAENIEQLYQQIHQIIAGLMPIQSFVIARYDIQHGISFGYNNADSTSSATYVSPDAKTTELCHQVISSGQSLLFCNAQQPSKSDRKKLTAVQPELNALVVPLKTHSGIIGALLAHNTSYAPCYSNAELEMLEFVATQVAVSIERKQMLARLKFHALYDQLTRLPNRELFQDRMFSALARAGREQGMLALLYLDLDKFKQVNDDFGHNIGDELLQQTALRLQQAIRQTDTAARFGGDEFVILLEQVSGVETAMLLAEKIRLALCQPYQIDSQRLTINPSIGVALYPQHGTVQKELVLNADEAMYLAKKAGGNRVVLSDGKLLLNRAAR